MNNSKTKRLLLVLVGVSVALVTLHGANVYLANVEKKYKSERDELVNDIVKKVSERTNDEGHAKELAGSVAGNLKSTLASEKLMFDQLRDLYEWETKDDDRKRYLRDQEQLRLQLLKENKQMSSREEEIMKMKTPDNVGKLGPKLVIVSGSDPQDGDKGQMWKEALLNRKEYCNYHGCKHVSYDFKDFRVPGKYKFLHPTWYKYRAMRQAMKEFPDALWYWWMDSDMLITNEMVDVNSHLLHPSVLGERVLYEWPLVDTDYDFRARYLPRNQTSPEQFDLVITHDWNGVNAGTFFMKNTLFIKWMLSVLDDGWFHMRDLPQLDQTPLIHWICHNEEVQKKTALVAQRTFNSYLQHPTSPYKDGDFALHFAGPVKNDPDSYRKIWRDQLNKRVRVPRDYWV